MKVGGDGWYKRLMDNTCTDMVPVTVTAPATKEEFGSVVRGIIAAGLRSNQVYSLIQEKVGPFDAQLAEHIRQCQVADDRLMAYLAKKIEGRG